ncbi:cytochrome c oxidase subunit 3 [Desertimonas flava]|uniref:cytochrome c oxidase subunit 3 n=1 Tax=Desertimonas flava TaxID=2064846 RepID=UPI000E34A970|nr:cytochrome c oxidase subunit 3 [Desertimonas flava]
MTYALPAAPAPPPRRQVFVGTAIASLGAIMLMGGMLAVFIRKREEVMDAGEAWLPQGVEIPGVPANVMLIGVLAIPLFAQWAVYAARRHDRIHVGLALGLVGVIGLAAINAQAYIYNRMDMPVADSGYAPMFYAITGAMVALLIIGVVFTGVTAFRLLGGRQSDTELVSAHALYWYVIAGVVSAVWLIVFVTK